MRMVKSMLAFPLERGSQSGFGRRGVAPLRVTIDWALGVPFWGEPAPFSLKGPPEAGESVPTEANVGLIGTPDLRGALRGGLPSKENPVGGGVYD